MPQTPNNAPTYKQLTFHNCARHVCHKAPFKHLVMPLRYVFHPDNFPINKKVSSMTLAHSTNQGATAPNK